MLKNIISIIIFLFHFNVIAQNDTLIGNVKSVSEKIIYLIEEPTLEDNCIDCDPTSFYQFGISLVTNPESYNSFFKTHWHNSAGSTYKNIYKEFNLEKQKTKEIWFDYDSSKKEQFLYEYDNNNNKIREVNISNELYYGTNNFHYDNKNRLISENSSYSNFFSYEINHYDKSDRIIKKDYYNENGYNFSAFYNYNDKENSVLVENNIAIIKTKDSITNTTTSITTTSLERKPIYKNYLNIENKIIEHHEYNFDEKLNKHFIYEKVINTYLNGKVTKRRTIEKDYTIEMNSEYNEFNKLKKYTEITPWKENNITREYFYTNKLLSKIEIKDQVNNKKNKTILTFEYKFDEKGNWTEQTKSVNSIPTYIWKREIKYYN
jgi:hypothetical protein